MALSRSFGQLANRFELYAKGIGPNVEKVVRRAALKGDTVLVLGTPFDTGRARGGWVTTTGKPNLGDDPQRLDPSGQASIAEATAIINSWNLAKGPIYFTNAVPYIVRLDEGYSAQAPRGMTRAAVTAMRRIMGRSKVLQLGGELNKFTSRKTEK